MKKGEQEKPLPVQRREEMPVAAQTPSVGQMLQAVIDKGVTTENVAAFEKLIELHERMEMRNSEKEFTKAFVLLQAEMPKIQAMTPIPDKHGVTKFKYAPYEDIWNQVSPYLKSHGFTVTFSTEFKEGRIIKTCFLQHVGGHKIFNTFAARIGGGPPGSNETQADGAASTYAKRFALCDILGIVIEKDSDARVEGKAITPEQADQLEHRAKMTNSDIKMLLRIAGAESFKEIPETKYDLIDELLSKKEKAGK